MRPLTGDDLLSPAEFAERRSEFLANHLKYLDRYRRVRVSPQWTLVFENRQTLWFRLQEFLRIARLTQPHAIRAALGWYNALLVHRGQLHAAVVPTPADAALTPVRWVQMVLGTTLVTASMNPDGEGDRGCGAAQWLLFALDTAERRGLADLRQPVFLRIEQDGVILHSPPLRDDVRQSLCDDLDLSDRAAA
jgi:hypothetical protein